MFPLELSVLQLVLLWQQGLQPGQNAPAGFVYGQHVILHSVAHKHLWLPASVANTSESSSAAAIMLQPLLMTHGHL